MAEAHLASGHDVIIPQYLGRPQFIEELEQLAATLAVPFHEIVLLDSKRHTPCGASTGAPKQPMTRSTSRLNKWSI